MTTVFRRRRRVWRRVILRGLALASFLAVTATLATALQIRKVRVSGARRFPPADVERALDSVLGSPTLTAKPDVLRTAVRALPWVADARVHVSIDGVVSCAVTERSPVAVATDDGQRELVDASGQLLGPATPSDSLLELDGFRPHPEERGAVLAAAPALQQAWGAALSRVTRLGPADVALGFADSDAVVVADPTRPSGVADARRVCRAWTAAYGAAPARLDARVAGRVAVTPAPEPEAAPDPGTEAH